jgi:hypothetical protein
MGDPGVTDRDVADPRLERPAPAGPAHGGGTGPRWRVRPHGGGCGPTVAGAAEPGLASFGLG